MVQHSFEGDAKLHNSTLDSRMEIRRALSQLHHQLLMSEGNPVQVYAHFELLIASPEPKEPAYTVTFNNSNFDGAGYFDHLKRDSSLEHGRWTASSPHGGGQRLA